ncbi:siderophore-interacting protein [Spongiibacter sp. IMCC21906]|jgi:NADPH-dependent ferric siderophore reductase|uniref:siderophore-interacting protein n=1 Tax=Spongiibacter sp. IMCC21906 TaxID=1620392 RepID=UPI00062DDF06|nr:siderophore-interacting protein [Spongiibacter sp. IMCC21906]AKH67950.1 siderophore-interacting protein [Spongiibacter sp. IMCC21906]
MAKSIPRELSVIRSTQITEHMLRITLGGDSLTSLPQDQESAYIKLIFPQADSERAVMRTYTIRHQRGTEIDVDFALHDQTGPASTWAIHAQAGDRILVGGPGPKKLINHDADWYLLAGDMTSLPAISVNLSQLPPNAIGYAVIEVLSETDIQPLEHPQNIALHWVINPHSNRSDTALLSKIQTLPWLIGQPAIWAACEFNSMRALRYFFRQLNIPKTHLYISSYWKMGQNEDNHKIAKRQDSEFNE